MMYYDTFVFLAKECNMILLFFLYSVNICNMTLLLFVESRPFVLLENNNLFSFSRNEIK